MATEIKTHSNRSNARRAIAQFRDKHPDMTATGLALVPHVGDRFSLVATLPAGATDQDVAACEAAGIEWTRLSPQTSMIKDAVSLAVEKGMTPKKGTKQDLVIKMLQRSKGATVPEVMEETGWQPHTTRAFISATVGKKLGHTLAKEKNEKRGLIYRIAA